MSCKTSASSDCERDQRVIFTARPEVISIDSPLPPLPRIGAVVTRNPRTSFVMYTRAKRIRATDLTT
ncbi:MAG: hypothetical protein J0H49_12750 [Acidobacteria bacterium]|nr:hypothetical protein [Acidobacteriota bacterium]